MLIEPLHQKRAKDLIRSILKDGDTTFSRHALDEMRADRHGEITRVDVVNVLVVASSTRPRWKKDRGDIACEPRESKSSWRFDRNGS